MNKDLKLPPINAHKPPVESLKNFGGKKASGIGSHLGKISR